MKGSVARVVVLAVVGLTAGIVIGGASAHTTSSGANIAAAPIVPPGQQEFGNSSTGWFDGAGNEPAEYWKLALVAGDRVTVDWESNKNSWGEDAVYDLDVWPVGTTDYSINDASPLEDFGIGDNAKAESTFTANVSGVFPIMFEGECCGTAAAGAYDFTAYVRHELVLAESGQTKTLLARAHRKPISHRGHIALAAHLADGTAISSGLEATLFAYWGSTLHAIGKGVAKDGQVIVPYRIPSHVHGVLRLTVSVAGSSYETKRISWRGVRA